MAQTGTRAGFRGIRKALTEAALVIGATGVIGVVIGLLPRFQ